MVTPTEKSCSKEEISVLKTEEFKNVECSIDTLTTALEQLTQKKTNYLENVQQLQEKARREGADIAMQRLLPLLLSLKALERQEIEDKSDHDAKCSKLKAEVKELESVVSCSDSEGNLYGGLDLYLHDSLERLNLRKKIPLKDVANLLSFKFLFNKLREIVSIKRQLGDVPSQAELIQYEHRFSELNVHIQEKLRQTRKFYATFNALLEIKDLMLKETSLLNSISSQLLPLFMNHPFASTTGRTNLIDSMEGIIKGTQQKLEKVQVALQADQQVCDAVKEKYAASVVEQRSCYSLLKSFQEECAKNERLRTISARQLP